eukprot:764765-Hanusia_phi.AAC.4
MCTENHWLPLLPFCSLLPPCIGIFEHLPDFLTCCSSEYAYIALKNALDDAGLKEADYQSNPRFASILGQGGTSIEDVVETVDAVKSKAPRWANKVGPYRVTRTMGSTVSAVLSTAFKLQGPSFSISSACSTGAHCIGEESGGGKRDADIT